MDDLYFEEELRRKIRANQIRSSRLLRYGDTEEFSNPFDGKKEITYDWCGFAEFSEEVKNAFDDFDILLEKYYERKSGNVEEENIFDDFCVPFTYDFSEKKLHEFFSNVEFTEEERYYIQLTRFKDAQYRSCNGATYAIAEIRLRRKIIEEFGEGALEEFRKIIKDLYSKDPFRYKNRYSHFSRLLSDKPYGEDIKKEYETEIEKATTYGFNDQINCGGYALKIDTTIFPPDKKSPYADIATILSRYPFIRLLSDTPLQEDEYLVIYRNGENAGHHFIRVDSDGVVREKDGNGEPRIFEAWAKNLSTDAVQAVFAVKKEHKMFGYRGIEQYQERESIVGLDFLETSEKVIAERQNSFIYRGKEYFLKKDSDNEALGIIVTKEGKKVAEVIIDGEEYLVDISESDRAEVENVSSSITPIIENGRLINFEQFKEGIEPDDNFSL